MTDREAEKLADITADLARKTAELQVLQRASSEINSTLDLEEIYDAALRTMGELFEFHHANILLLEPGGDILTVVASRGYENQAVGGRVRIGTGVIGIVAQKRKMLHVSNLGQQRAYAAAQRREMVKSGRGAEIADAVPVPGLPNAESQFAIPLMVRDDLIGVFSIESPVRRTFSEHDRALVSTVASGFESSFLARLELAARGTLYLDAVQELPSPLQHVLTDLLDKRDPNAPDVRVIAATPRDLTREPQDRLHEPLLQRLARNVIHVPALADRRDDIPVLVDYFVRRHARRIGKIVDGVSATSMERLQTYAWPGNIRELRTVVERAILVSTSSLIEVDEELLDERLAVGSYRLIAPLGSGGMGEVWRARHRLLARPAAVKLIRYQEEPGPARE